MNTHNFPTRLVSLVKMCFLLIVIFLTSNSIIAQTSTKDYADLKLSSVKSLNDLRLILDNEIVALESLIANDNTNPYDKVLFSAYRHIIKNITTTASPNDLDVLSKVYSKFVSEELTSPEFKILNENDLGSLMTGLVELLQVTPQVEVQQGY